MRGKRWVESKVCKRQGSNGAGGGLHIMRWKFKVFTNMMSSVILDVEEYNGFLGRYQQGA